MQFTRAMAICSVLAFSWLGGTTGCNYDFDSGGGNLDKLPDRSDPMIDPGGPTTPEAPMDPTDPIDPIDPGPVNAVTDSYDPIDDRMLTGDCSRNALVAIDRASGDESVLLIDEQWPFEVPGRICPRKLARQADNKHIFAVVSNSYDDPDDPDEGCIERNLVDIPADGPPSVVKLLDRECCDDCGDYTGYDALLIDDAHERLVVAKNDCGSNNECDSDLVSYDREGQSAGLVFPIYKGDGPSIGPIADDLALDPRSPDNSVFALLNEDDDGDHTVDVIDVDTDTRTELVTLITTWPTLPANISPYAIRVDAEREKLYVIARVLRINGGHVVVQVDIKTGAQALVYDGRATAEDEIIDCTPGQVAFDSTRNQMLFFIEPSQSRYRTCNDGLLAANLENGTLTREPYTPSAALLAR